MSNYDYDCWGGPDGRCGVHKVPYVYLDGVPESGRECAASWVMRALAAEAALDQVRDALHTAYSIIANAQNCLGDGDPTLGPQWHEAAARFMQDYNTNLDAYTGYRASSGVSTPEPCGAECGNSVHMHRCQITDGVPHDHICYDCGYTWTWGYPSDSTLWKCADCGGIFFDRESHACPEAIERLTAERDEFKKGRDALRPYGFGVARAVAADAVLDALDGDG